MKLRLLTLAFSLAVTLPACAQSVFLPDSTAPMLKLPATIAAPQRATFFGQNTSGCGAAYTDGFVKPNGTVLIYSPWAQSSPNNIVIQSDAATSNGTTGNTYAWLSSCSAFGSSQYSEASVKAVNSSSYVWMSVYQTNSTNAYYVVCNPGTTCYAVELIATTPTTAGTYSYTLPVNTTVTMCAELDSGPTLKLKINGSYIGAGIAVSGLSSGVPGIGMYSTNVGDPTVATYSGGSGTCPI